jgi:biotin carboxyl carrier protein
MNMRARSKPRWSRRLGFRVGGKIIKRQAELGQRVKAGQVLAQLDPQDFRLAADSARAQVAAATTNRDLAAADFKRYKELKEQNFISGAELERRETTLKAAQAQLEQAQSQFSVQGNQANYAALVADVSGVVTAIEAEPGQVVTAGAPWCASPRTACATWCSRCPKTRWRASSPARRSRSASGRKHRACRQGQRSGRQQRPRHAHLHRQGVGRCQGAAAAGRHGVCGARSRQHAWACRSSSCRPRPAPGRQGHGRVGGRQGHHDRQAANHPGRHGRRQRSGCGFGAAARHAGGERRRARAVAGPEGHLYQPSVALAGATAAQAAIGRRNPSPRVPLRRPHPLPPA